MKTVVSKKDEDIKIVSQQEFSDGVYFIYSSSPEYRETYDLRKLIITNG